jgi:hypothetical protein
VATETHIAGLQVKVSDRYLMQRCAWCGAVMSAYDLTRVATVGEWQEPAMFEVNRLIRFTYDGAIARFGEVALTRTMMELLDEQDKLPDDACALLIPFENGAE